MDRTRNVALVALTVALILSLAGIANGDAITSGLATPIVPVDEIRSGMMLEGLSVVRGSEPVGFEAEVLGVLRDYLAPGKDVIAAALSGDAIDDAGGAWFGMSGSPVYLGDGFVGAVSWVIGWVPSNIVGITPAADILGVMDHPVATDAKNLPNRVPVPKWLKMSIAARTGTQVGEIPESFLALRVPLAVSGVGGRVSRVQSLFSERGLHIVPFAGGSAEAGDTISSETPEPGDNFAATLSYGQITSSAGGTVTYVTEDGLVAFGHPIWGMFAPVGGLTLGAHAASSPGLAISPFGTFKMHEVGALIGTVDLERFAGVRALLGVIPTTVPVEVSAYSVENDAYSSGRTDVVLNEEVAWIAPTAVSSNVYSAADRGGPGTADVRFTIRGTTATGGTWMIERDNTHANRSDIGWASASELSDYLYKLVRTRLADVTISSVDVEVAAREEVARYRLGSVRSSTDGNTFSKDSVVYVTPGGTVYLRLNLKDDTGALASTVRLRVRIPREAHTGGAIYVGGGRESVVRRRAGSFTNLLEMLRDRPRNNDAVATLFLGRRSTPAAIASKTLERVLIGGKTIVIEISGAEGPEYGRL